MRVRARSAAEVGYRPGRRDHARELAGGPLDQLTLPRLIPSALPGRALAVVKEAEEPVRGRHGDDTTGTAAAGLRMRAWPVDLRVRDFP